LELIDDELADFSLRSVRSCCLLILGTSLGERATNVDEVICDYAEPNRRFIPSSPYVATALRPCQPLATVLRPLASGSPFLTVAELALLALALSAFGGAIGDEDVLDAFCFRSFLFFVGMKTATSRCGVRRRCHLGSAPPLIEHASLRKG